MNNLERELLSYLVQNPTYCNDCRAEWFSERGKKLFISIGLSLVDSSVDWVKLVEHSGWLSSEIASLSNSELPSIKDIKNAIKKFGDLYARNTLLLLAEQIKHQIADENIATGQIKGKLEQSLSDIQIQSTVKDEIVKLSDINQDLVSVTESFPTGYPKLDDITDGGFKAGELVVITGHSGHGKTLFLTNLIYNISKLPIPCLYFSYEVQLSSLYNSFKKMGLNEDNFVYVPLAVTEFNDMGWIKRKVKEAKEKQMIKAIVIDSTDYVIPTNIKSQDDEFSQIRNLFVELKKLAIQEDIIIFAHHHIKKDTSTDNAPKMTDIYGSSKVYQLSDYVFAVWRVPAVVSKQKLKNETEATTFSKDTRIVTLKNRRTGNLNYFTVYYSDGTLYEV